jgi:site-specific recombinase XerD
MYISMNKRLTHGRSPDELLFVNLPRIDSFAEMLHKDMKAAGISITVAGERVDFHALRHTYVTNLVASGMNPKTAMDLARHSDVNLTFARYAHVTTRQKADALKAVKSLDFDKIPPEQEKSGE